MNIKKIFIALCLSTNLFVYCATDNDLQIPLASPSPNLFSRFELLHYLPKGAVVAEIGVERGDFAAAILKYTDPKKLYLIDCWERKDDDIYSPNSATQKNNYEWVQQRFKNDPRVEIIRACSPDVAQLFKDKFFDWIYLDANHSYATVKTDLKCWHPKIKSGGIFVGHGYTSHVLRPNFGVVQAVNEFMRMYGLTMLYLTNETFANWAIKID